MKKVEQVSISGETVKDYDQILSLKQIGDIFNSLFPSNCKKDGKQYVLFNAIGVLAANVTYLGNPHPDYKKRIQLKNYYLDYLAKNKVDNKKTFYVGIYTYEETRLFVVFETTTYEEKKSHNSSAHVMTFDLQYAQKAGKYSKKDAFGNSIHVLKAREFERYIEEAVASDDKAYYEDIIKLVDEYLADFITTIPPLWEGITCYKEMLEVRDNNARQGAWQGFYFEHLFKKFLGERQTNLMEWHSDKRKNAIDFDLVISKEKWIYGDLKADTVKTDIPGNAFSALDKVITHNHGKVFYLCCFYKRAKDSNHDYKVTKYWNEFVRRSNKHETDEQRLKSRYGRRMVFSVAPIEIRILKIDEVAYEILKTNPFRQGKNSDGKSRSPKMMVSRDMIDALSVFVYRF